MLRNACSLRVASRVQASRISKRLVPASHQAQPESSTISRSYSTQSLNESTNTVCKIGASAPHTQFVRWASFAKNTPTTGIVPFKLADVGEGIAECEVLKWHIAEGDTVKEFDPICEVQSDKATVEITSRFNGKVTKLHYKKGDMAKVGKPLIDIDLGGGPALAVNTIVPELVEKLLHPDTVVVVAAPAASVSSGAILATPAVRHIAKTKKIDLSTIKGSGKEGRILKEDLIAYEQNKGSASIVPPVITNIIDNIKQTASDLFSHGAPATPSAPVTPSVAAVPAGVRESKQSLSGIKRVMARTMTAASQVPHFGYCDEWTMDGLQHMRNNLKAVAESRGVKITYMPFFIKAASLALLRYPALNSSINNEMTEVTLKHYHNIGVAMDTPSGLLVPNIKDVQNKSIIEIAQEMSRLHKAAINNQLSPADMSGGTFTLSNIGTIGGTYASPVLVVPEVAIGAIGRIQKVPRYNAKGEIVPVSILQVSWSADHRVIDGATMANFSNLMKMYIEKPESMISELK